jgi:hypothetical protein
VEQLLIEVMNREWTVNGLTRNFGIEWKTAYSSREETWAAL